jgi:hypothetical protein
MGLVSDVSHTTRCAEQIWEKIHEPLFGPQTIDMIDAGRSAAKGEEQLKSEN